MATDEPNEDYLRDFALDTVIHGEFVAGIRMEMWPEAVGYGALDDYYDEDGDSIIARSAGLGAPSRRGS